ncbi:MarR family winged helix-turn-helix transcriptional regulator [Xanthobacter tagetidis]|jgi:DNA-binding MarR family transcriptional regulator|nr:MarR family transcriptional regulator [Xanthobacter tagetidis]MBB6310324.1 DNA-binding MarR family transcriptional regulator [Xanthobacter tagetidis]
MSPPGRGKPAGSFRPPVTISRAEFLRGEGDRAFRESIYAMVMALEGLLKCRAIFGKVLGLTPSQFAVLMGTAYRQGEDGVAIRDLADHIRLAAPHVTTEVGRMIEMGLLAKRQDESDRRSVRVSLSPDGEQAVVRVAPVVRRVNDMLFEEITSSELAVVETVMRKLAISAERVFAHAKWGDILDGDDAGIRPDGAARKRRPKGPAA